MSELKDLMLEYRVRENIKQKTAAERARVSPQIWCNIENGRQHPSKLTEIKIRQLVDTKEGSR